MRSPHNNTMQASVIFMAALVSIFFLLSTVLAQEGMNAAGGNISSSQGTISYSVGQIFYQTYHDDNGSVSQGVQQPFEISVVTSTEEVRDISLSIMAYPNPTSDYLKLEIPDCQLFPFAFHLYDMNGRLLQTDRITQDQTTIDVSTLKPAVYFLRVIKTQENTPAEIKLFKIIKN
jgi:hypothetical protein